MQHTFTLIVLLAALFALPSRSLGQATPELLASAASCLQRFGDGEELPEVRRNSAAPPEHAALLVALMGTPSDPEAADARARLAQCMPNALHVPSRLTRHQGRWLAGCFDEASLALRSAQTAEARASARRRAEGCKAIAQAMSTWDPDISTMYAGRSAAAPGVRLQPVRDSGSAHSRTLTALEEGAQALAACRTAHGEGSVRVVARFDADSRAWQIEAWLLQGAAPLTECTRAVFAATRALAPSTHDEIEAFDLQLTTPARNRNAIGH